MTEIDDQGFEPAHPQGLRLKVRALEQILKELEEHVEEYRQVNSGAIGATKPYSGTLGYFLRQLAGVEQRLQFNKDRLARAERQHGNPA